MSQEWLKKRQGLLTASDASFLFKTFSENSNIKEIMQDFQIYKTPYTFYHEKTMSEKRYFLYNFKVIDGNYKMKRGNKLENDIINNFYEWSKVKGLNLGELTKNEDIVVLDGLKIGATPDAYLPFDKKKALLEVKTTEKNIYDVLNGYRLQVLWQLKCTNLDLGFIHICQINKKEYIFYTDIVSSKHWEHYNLFLNEIETVSKNAWKFIASQSCLEPCLDIKSDRIIKEVLSMTDNQVEEELSDYEVIETTDTELAKYAEIIGKYNLTIADLKEMEKQAEEAKNSLKEKLTLIKNKNLLINSPDGNRYKVKKIEIEPTYWDKASLEKEIEKFKNGQPKKVGYTKLNVEVL